MSTDKFCVVAFGVGVAVGLLLGILATGSVTSAQAPSPTRAAIGVHRMPAGHTCYTYGESGIFCLP